MGLPVFFSISWSIVSNCSLGTLFGNFSKFWGTGNKFSRLPLLNPRVAMTSVSVILMLVLDSGIILSKISLVKPLNWFLDTTLVLLIAWINSFLKLSLEFEPQSSKSRSLIKSENSVTFKPEASISFWKASIYFLFPFNNWLKLTFFPMSCNSFCISWIALNWTGLKFRLLTNFILIFFWTKSLP